MRALCLGLVFFAVSTVYAQSDQTIGGNLSSTGDLRITYRTDGRMNVERYNGSSYVSQVFGGSAKGSRLYQDGNAYAFGYYSGTSTPVLDSLTAETGTRSRITAVWTVGSYAYKHTITYTDGDGFYTSLWSVTNNSGVTAADIRFFHGEDTYLSGGDNGAGFYEAANNTVGVGRTGGGTVQRFMLQGVDTPFAYQSENYSSVRSAVNSSGLSNTIDSNPATDNGYAMEWRTTSLASGDTWTVKAAEKFFVTTQGSLLVTAPVISDAVPGTTISIPFVVTNTSGGSLASVNANVTSSTSGWTASVTSPAGAFSLTTGASQTVTVSVDIPAGAAPGERSSIELTSDSGGFFTADQSIAEVPNTVPSIPTDIDSAVNTVSEAAVNGATVGITILSTDSDTGQTLSYSLVDSAGGRFAINASTGVVTVANSGALDYESNTSHTILVQVSDGVDVELANFSIAVEDVDELAPTDITLSSSSFTEGVAIGTEIGTLSSVDATSGDTFTYSLVSGTGDTDNSLVTISGNSLRVGADILFASTPTLSVRVRSTDATGNTFDKALSLTVLDDPAIPVVSSSSPRKRKGGAIDPLFLVALLPLLARRWIKR